MGIPSSDYLNCLVESISAVCPMESVCLHEVGNATFKPAANATAEQIIAGAAVITNFDWSAPAIETYVENKEPLLKDIRDQANQAIADIDAYLAIADTATNAQVRAEVKAIDVRQKRIIKALRRIITLIGQG